MLFKRSLLSFRKWVLLSNSTNIFKSEQIENDFNLIGTDAIQTPIEQDGQPLTILLEEREINVEGIK